jgi:hypothetical protein
MQVDASNLRKRQHWVAVNPPEQATRFRLPFRSTPCQVTPNLMSLSSSLSSRLQAHSVSTSGRSSIRDSKSSRNGLSRFLRRPHSSMLMKLSTARLLASPSITTQTLLRSKSVTSASNRSLQMPTSQKVSKRWRQARLQKNMMCSVSAWFYLRSYLPISCRVMQLSASFSSSISIRQPGYLVT